jgi:uncharacterized protein (TIGR03546 family)
MTLILYLVNVNLGFGLLGILITTVLSFGLDPWAGKIGALILSMPTLTPLWTLLYNIPLVPFTRFNNTVMMGSVILALILAIPIYLGVKWAVVQYRLRWYQTVEQWKAVRWVKRTKWFMWIMHIKDKAL